MIYEALEIIVDEINELLAPGDPSPPLLLGNIAKVNDGDEFSAELANKIVLSIVNIEEDKVARNPLNYIKQNNKILYKNPPIHINLTLLFSATLNYDLAITYLEQILLFFQDKYVFTRENTKAIFEELPELDKLIFELLSLNLEQVNQLWTTLGGHYMPSVVYRLRMIKIDNNTIQSIAEPIKEIKLSESRL
jgi:hypothetical protein